ncbi:hypothetical protein GGR16_004190 [Chelatococcus caeni]|uniref:Uncharacterized protein n=1 Tax=Chelatococcus caeni TaxID=1348468 RepID=A0A840C2U1_9HYPH|nr:hypothetical protein [Chelatococcus caeni]
MTQGNGVQVSGWGPSTTSPPVLAGLVPAIHAFRLRSSVTARMPATSAGMTVEGAERDGERRPAPGASAAPGRYGSTTTGVPTATRSKRSMISALCMRMQP